MNYLQITEISHDFRHYSSQLFRSNYNDGKVNLKRFNNYINSQPYILDLISKSIEGIEYNYQDCFHFRDHGHWMEINKPVDEKEHIKAMYDLIQFMVSDDRNFGNVFHSYLADGNLNERMKSFMKSCFIDLYHFINNDINKQLNLLKPRENKGMIVNQHINTNYGPINTVETGTIHSSNNIDTKVTELQGLINHIESLLPSQPLSQEVQEDLVDDLEVVREQLAAETPSMSKLRKVQRNIGSFLSNLPKGIALGSEFISAVTTLFQQLPGLQEAFNQILNM